MKETNKRKKILITLGCIITLLLVVGVSYAYWSLTFVQSENNVVTTDCFEIKFLEGNAINLTKAYPVSDADGLKNTPYTFTIKNVCESSAKYQINLETMNHNNKKLPDEYLKVNLTESNVSKITTKLESSLITSTTIEGAIDAYELLMGVLGPNETKEFSLRIWMHSEVTAMEQDSMNATYNGKISVITSYYQDNRGTLLASGFDNETYEASMDYFWQYSETISSIVFENELKEHEDAIDTFDVSESQDGSVMSYLVPGRSEEEAEELFKEEIGMTIEEYKEYLMSEAEYSEEEADEEIRRLMDYCRGYILYIQSDGGIIANKNSMGLFAGFVSLETIDGIEYLDTSNVTDMSYMFYDCRHLEILDLSNFNTSNVTDMGHMFSMNAFESFVGRLTSLDLSNFDTSNVTNMWGMFFNCYSLTNIDLSSFDTSNVTNMTAMFSECSSLTSLDLSSFDTSKVTNMSYMFYDCENLTNLDLSSFNTSNVTNTARMFRSCSSLTNLNLGKFDISSMTNSGEIFENMPKTSIVKVRNETTRDWVLKQNSAWSVDNVIIEL